MPWYVIRTKPRHERAAEFHLRQVCAEVFMPMLLQAKAIRSKQRPVKEPMFPGYVFAQFDLHASYRAVKFARGVLNIVEFGLKPAEVGDATIDAIKERLEHGCVQIAAPSFQEGQVVRIAEGPLAGLEAVFLREMKKQQRVCVLLNMLGLQTKMTMGIDQIRLPQAV